ncbi:TrkH family potassium uptake protein [Brachybacterium saurashtrense]|uniref:TrkH family potassium uptake protein n=1 Tax=Brachybacterium saurashtrense TaxID=556288 RepID=A0A345YQQ9_9MICO|nr:potassium transporter TrkG [Brachybacterium saurashtrense]AXK46261.1 TrkH family potassium uptake protein [Brachybacterium saurashtrense]RRR24001.1 TrkH family potassium uptake protein [Brachybacterium saurashtrense]
MPRVPPQGLLPPRAVDRRPRPARTVFLAFAGSAVLGTLLLLLPEASAGERGPTVVEALFTAVSSLSVTGLIVVDTPVFWSAFGQAVILALIQLGGLGVMTFASVVGIAVVRRLSLRSKLTAAVETKAVGLQDLRSVVLGVLRISLMIEAIAAVVLTLRFALAHQETWGRALWLGVFHAVSSFNNAGFALFSDSLMSFWDDPVVLLTTSGATVLGGLGFPVLMELRKHLRVVRLWSMNTRIVVAATPLLLVLGTLCITALEWNNPGTLGPMPVPARILNGFAMSAQTRTAGFNTVDTGAMDPATWVIIDMLMVIGGGPAGTAGGIKVTTVAVLFFLMLGELRGAGAVTVFGKRLSRAVHRQAITVIVMSVGLIVASTIALMLLAGFSLDATLFEVISAFATVGLSTGITAALPASAQLILVALMAIGRLGPITVATGLALRRRTVLYDLPKERPIIG